MFRTEFLRINTEQEKLRAGDGVGQVHTAELLNLVQAGAHGVAVNAELRGSGGQVGVAHEEGTQGGAQLCVVLRIVLGQAADCGRAPGSEGLGYAGLCQPGGGS